MKITIPDESIYRPEVEAEDLPRKHVPEMRGVSIAPGLEAVGEALQQKYQADIETAAGNQLSDLRVKMTQAMEQAKQSVGPNGEGYTKAVLGQFDQQAEGYTGDDANPYLSRAMGPGLQRMRAQFAQSAVEYEAQAGVAYRAQSARDSVDKLATVASQHPEQAADLTAQALKQVNGAQLDPQVQLAAARYAESTINKSALEARIQADPYATMQALLKPSDADGAVQALRPDERDTLLSHADAMLHQRVEDSERLSELNEKQERDAASSALSGLLVKSQSPDGVTMDDVRRVAPLFRHDPSGLEAAINLASGKEAVTDVHTYLPLLQQAMNGKDVSGEVFAHAGHDLSKEDASRLLELSDKGLPNAYKQGVDDINGIFKEGPLDKYDPAFNVRHMNALDDYYAWARTNPNATADQASMTAKRIAQSYSDAQLASSSETWPLPRFAVGNRASLNVDASAAATAHAEKSGRISHAEAVREMALIARWRGAIDRTRRGGRAP